MCFVRLIFVAAIDYENIFTMTISRFTVLLHKMLIHVHCIHHKYTHIMHPIEKYAILALLVQVRVLITALIVLRSV